MSQSYFYFHQGEVVSVSGVFDAQPSEIPGDYEIIQDGKRVPIPAASGALVYMGVSKEEFEQLKGEKFKGTEIQKKILSGKITKPEQIHSQLSMEHLQNPGLIEVLFTGLGCLLISRKVLEKIEFDWAEDSFDDAKFAEDARKKGFKVYVDTRIRCEHIINQKESWDGIKY